MSGNNNVQEVIVEYKPSPKTGAEIHQHFLVKFLNGRKSEYRKCVKCSELIKCPKSGTSALHIDHNLCRQPRSQPVDVDQRRIPFQKTTQKPRKGLPECARLVYEDNFAITKVVKSKTLQSFYNRLNFATVSYNSVNQQLESDYQYVFQNIKKYIAKRNKQHAISISYDKWTAADNKKFIGVYLYVSGKFVWA